MPMVTIQTERCKGCGLCVSVCPTKILVISNNINANGYKNVMCVDVSKCIGCAACYNMCPDCVLTVER